MEITVGTRVVVIDREQLPADVKSGLFYPHYAGLTGEVLKVYGQECAVLVDRTALPPAIYERHQQNEKQQRQRWQRAGRAHCRGGARAGGSSRGSGAPPAGGSSAAASSSTKLTVEQAAAVL